MSLQAGFTKRIRKIMRKDAGINGDAQRIEQMVWMLFLKVYDAKEDDWELLEEGYTSIIPEECRWRKWAKADSNGHSMTGDELLDFVNNKLFPTLKELPVTSDTPVKKAIVKTTFEDANNYMKDGVYLRQVIDIIDEIEFDDVKESHAFGDIYEDLLKELQSAGSSGEFYTPRAVTDFMAMMVKPQIGEKMADFACGTGGFITSWLKQLSMQVTDTGAKKELDDSIYGIEKKPFPYLLCVTNMLLHDIEVPNIYHMNSLQRNLLDYTEDDKFDVILMNPPYGGEEDNSVKHFFPADLASGETADLFMVVIMQRLKKNGRAAVVVPDNFLYGTDNLAIIEIKKKLISEFNLHTVIRMPGSVFAPYTPIATNIVFFDNTHPTKETWFYRLDMPTDRKHFSKTKPMELKHFDEVVTWWNDRKEVMENGNLKAQKYSADYLINDRGCDLSLCCYPEEEIEVLDPKDTMQDFKRVLFSFSTELDNTMKSIYAVINGEPSAADEKYQYSCNMLSESIKNFPDTLCASLLQYAMQGKLVEQVGEAEEVEEFLRKANQVKQKMIKNGVIKKGKPLEDISEDDIPFDIPDTWRWVHVGDVFYHNTGKALNAVNREGVELEYITTSNLYWNRFELESLRKMYFKEDEVDKYSAQKGDLLVCEGGDIGRAAIWNYDYSICIQNHIHKLRPYISLNVKFFYYVFYMYKLTGRIAGKGIGIQGLSSGVLDKLVIPFPSVEEQNNIVEVLEKLLPFCDRLRN